MTRIPQSRFFGPSELMTSWPTPLRTPALQPGSSPGATLARLLKQARFIQQLDQLLAGYLPPDLAVQCQVASVRQNRMVLISPTASWATRLRMQSNQMLDFLHASGHAGIQSINVRVAPIHRPAPETRTRHPLSPAAKQAIDLMALKKWEGVD